MHQTPLHALVHTLTDRGLTVATAESLTAGLLAARIADVPGASAILNGGVVSYQNKIKQRVLGVDAHLLSTRGAVDPVTAEQMARGAQRVCDSDIGISTTGVAGPEPHQGKDVGTVYIGLCIADHVSQHVELHLQGDRAQIRHQTVEAAITQLCAVVD
ncbi:CinA family protein [Auritidibacter sp. NML100628]|uniref:CinA family protein n=1 Tax=Auritidibacter sp. NML100628 TaxID=2170742 RepID=UPI000D73D504|nr:nicotinamide-nucleotide amidohydrolase family protein [Auritidibacter sp. NML100628]PXA76083.1 damage-inducible protein CinA [Auritidibacter sp. NML100628]